MTDTPMTSPAMAALMTAVMMVAMMLPSLAAALWSYHRDLLGTRLSRAGERTTLFAAGYVGVWTVVSLLLFAMSAGLPSRDSAPSVSLVTGAVILSAGALQRSRWKTRQLARCRQSCVPALVSTEVTTAWRDGCWLGVDCALSCAALMTILLVPGLMNARMMVAVAAAITAERVMPAGARIARLTGTVALIAGTIICLQALSDFTSL